MINLFTDLQEAIAARIETDDFVAGLPPIPVVTEKRGDLGRMIQEGIGKCGMVVVVTTPRLVPDPEIPSALTVSITLGVGERAATNRGPTGTRKPAIDLVVVLIALLWHWRPTGGWTEIEFLEATLEDVSDLVSYQLTFETRIRVESGTA